MGNHHAQRESRKHSISCPRLLDYNDPLNLSQSASLQVLLKSHNCSFDLGHLICLKILSIIIGLFSRIHISSAHQRDCFHNPWCLLNWYQCALAARGSLSMYPAFFWVTEMVYDFGRPIQGFQQGAFRNMHISIFAPCMHSRFGRRRPGLQPGKNIL